MGVNPGVKSNPLVVSADVLSPDEESLGLTEVTGRRSGKHQSFYPALSFSPLIAKSSVGAAPDPLFYHPTPTQNGREKPTSQVCFCRCFVTLCSPARLKTRETFQGAERDPGPAIPTRTGPAGRRRYTNPFGFARR